RRASWPSPPAAYQRLPVAAMRVAIGYEGAPMAMTLEVYPSDAEAFEAAAALAAEHVRSTGARAAVALAGGRSGRGVMTALAARGDLPWERVEWFWGDERCVPADDGRSNLRLARDSLFVPRGVPAGRIHPPPVALGHPLRLAAGRHVIVTAVGGEKAAAVAAAVDDGADPAGVPAALVRPSERITWFIDRAAASVLLRAARPAPAQ